MALSRTVRDKALTRSFDLGDRVRQDRRNPDGWLVSSATHPNVWYRVQMNRGCGCKGFAERRMCRHYVRVSWELHQQRTAAQAA